MNVTDLPERIASKIRVDESTGCWEWTAALGTRGYGQCWYEGKLTGAHRVTYTLLMGPIPDGLVPDHLCRNRPCVNPAHLEPVTTRENLLRGVGFPATNAAKQHCGAGHPFDEQNTYTDPRGRRECKECRKARMSAYYRRRTGAAA